MRKPGVLLLLILTLVIALATLAQNVRFDQSLDRERAAGLALAREFGSIDTALSDVRGAQAAYVATGQDPAVWMSKVTDLFAQVDAGLTRLRQSTMSAEAKARYDAAAAALVEFVALDHRARENARTDRFLASDLIFEDAVEVNKRLAGELGAARGIDARANEERGIRLTRLRLGMNVAALGFVTLVALFFRRAARRAGTAAGRTDLHVRQDEPRGLGLGPDPQTADAGRAEADRQADLQVRQERQAETPVRESLPLKPPPAPPVVPVLPPPAPANLTEAAELCVDLARVIDSRDVPSLVERAANVLQAKGIVLWVADSAGAILRPSITHGYSEKVLARLGPLQIDADNVTSLAFRSMRPQSMNGSAPGAPAAIAVPLLTASGCVGVLAAEIKQDKPGGDLLPLARMIAAQFAALIAPSDERSLSKAAEV